MTQKPHFAGLYEDQRRRIVADDTPDELPFQPERIIDGLVQAIADFEVYRQSGAFSEFSPEDLANRVFEQLCKSTPTLHETVGSLHPDPIRYPDDEAYQIALMLAVIQRCFVPAHGDPTYDQTDRQEPPRYHDAALATSELFAATATADSLLQEQLQNEQDAIVTAKHMERIFSPLVDTHAEYWKERVFSRAGLNQELLTRIAGEQYDDVKAALHAAGVVPSTYLIELLESNPENVTRFINVNQATRAKDDEAVPDWTSIRKAEQFIRTVDQDLETLRGEWTTLNRIRPLEIIDIAYRLTIDHPPAIESPGAIDWEALLTSVTVNAIVETRDLSYGGSRAATAVLRRISSDDGEDCRTIRPLVRNVSSDNTNDTWKFTQYGLAIGYLLQEVDGPVTDPVFDIEEWRTHFHQVIAMTTEPEHHLLYEVSDTFEEYNPGADDSM